MHTVPVKHKMGNSPSKYTTHIVAGVLGALAYRALSSRANVVHAQTKTRRQRTSSNDEEKDTHDMVRDRYDKTVMSTDPNEQGCCQTITVTPGEKLGYSKEDMAGLAASDVTVMLGCGTPVELANLQEGETVVDLGSGAGVDCILASRKVGTAGQVIGVDMTPSMLTTARKCARKIVPDGSGRGKSPIRAHQQ